MAKLYGNQGSVTLNTESVSNGTFTGNATGWTVGSGWAYSANTVVKGSDGTATLSQDIGAIPGNAYTVTYTISNLTVGSVTPSLGGVNLTQRSADGTYTQTIVATSRAALAFTPTSTARFTIDTVTVTGGGPCAVKAWVIDTKVDIEDVTDFTDAADGWKVKHASLSEWSGSLDAILTDAERQVIAGTTGALTVTTSSGESYSGTIVVESSSNKGSADGKALEFTIKFEGVGALTPPYEA